VRARRYFLFSFLLPIILPLVTLLVTRAGFRESNSGVLILWGSLLIGGVPYILFLAALFYWARDKDFKAIQRVTPIAPLLFIPVFVYCALAIIPLQILKTGEVRVEGNVVFNFCILILILGYFYVLLANGGFYLLKFIGFIKEDAYQEPVLASSGTRLGGKKYLLAFFLSLPLLLIPVSLFIQYRHQQNYPKRIAEANSIESSVNRDEAILSIACEQARAQRYEEAKATVTTYLVDKDRGFASIVTNMVYSGSYVEAKSMAESIAAPVLRIMAYRQIAVAQAKAGDRSGASQTLSAALEIARRAENASLKRFTLPTIAVGQAEAELDGDLKATLKMVEPSEIVETYRFVASINARDGRLEEAQEYFRQAILKTKNIKDPISRDSKLADISESQADVGLLDDARATVELIALDGGKQIAIRHISDIENGVIKRLQR
jgi:tetratricopeptide (TPR) repeat protein